MLAIRHYVTSERNAYSLSISFYYNKFFSGKLFSIYLSLALAKVIFSKIHQGLFLLLFHCLLQKDVQTRLKSYKTRRRLCFCCPFYFTSKVASSAGSMVGSISSRPRSSRLSLRSRDMRTDSTGTNSPLANRNSQNQSLEDKVEGRRSVIQQRLSTLNAITEEEPVDGVDSESPRARSAPPPRRSVLIPPTNLNGLTPPRIRNYIHLTSTLYLYGSYIIDDIKWYELYPSQDF